MPSTTADQKQALERALEQIKRNHGPGAIRKLGDEAQVAVDVIPTGSLALDQALGVGGLPKGRITEIYGPEGSGKTTVCLHVIANVQQQGGTAAFIDVEHALDPEYARKLGVNIEQLLVAQPDTGEQALEIAETLIRSGAVSLVVIDSVAALVPRAEIEGEMGDAHVGLQARLMSQAMRKLSGAVGRTKTALMFTNQIRMKIGVTWGSPETTSGGRALRFYSSVRLDIRRVGSVKNGDEKVANRTRVKVVKNKVAAPFKKAEFDIAFGRGIDYEGELIDLGEEQEIVERAGAWYSYNDTNLGQGRENSKQFLRENPEVFEALEREVHRAVGLEETEEEGADVDAAEEEGDAEE